MKMKQLAAKTSKAQTMPFQLKIRLKTPWHASLKEDQHLNVNIGKTNIDQN